MRDIFAIICRELAASVADEESTREAITYLEKFGIYNAGQDFTEATNRVISSLFAVGKLAAENGLEAAARQAASALAALTISSKEIIKATIRNYESKLK